MFICQDSLRFLHNASRIWISLTLWIDLYTSALLSHYAVTASVSAILFHLARSNKWSLSNMSLEINTASLMVDPCQSFPVEVKLLSHSATMYISRYWPLWLCCVPHRNHAFGAIYYGQSLGNPRHTPNIAFPLGYNYNRINNIPNPVICDRCMRGPLCDGKYYPVTVNTHRLTL